MQTMLCGVRTAATRREMTRRNEKSFGEVRWPWLDLSGSRSRGNEKKILNEIRGSCAAAVYLGIQFLLFCWRQATQHGETGQKDRDAFSSRHDDNKHRWPTGTIVDETKQRQTCIRYLPDDRRGFDFFVLSNIIFSSRLPY